MWERQCHAGAKELIEEVEIQAIVLGDIAIFAYPEELFTAFGRRLKDRSPFANTVAATMTNGWHGRAPTLDAFDRGGYETYLANQSRLVPEAGDLMTDSALDLLRRLAVDP